MSFVVSSTLQTLMTTYVQDVWGNVPGVTGAVVVFKEPIKNIISIPAVNLFGYENEAANVQEITYTPVSQTFGAQVIYQNQSKGNNPFFDDKIRLENNSIYLRCQQNCRDYIKNGAKTINIQADNKIWNLQEGEQIQNFLNLKFYFFEIKATN